MEVTSAGSIKAAGATGNGSGTLGRLRRPGCHLDTGIL